MFLIYRVMVLREIEILPEFSVGDAETMFPFSLRIIIFEVLLKKWITAVIIEASRSVSEKRAVLSQCKLIRLARVHC